MEISYHVEVMVSGHLYNPIMIFIKDMLQYIHAGH